MLKPENELESGWLIISVKNIEKRDFAIAGATVCDSYSSKASELIMILLKFSANPGYSFKVAAHWISSYFLKDSPIWQKKLL